MLLDGYGEIEHPNLDAERWLAEHFGAPEHPGWLPRPVAEWLALPPRPALVSVRDGRRLTVHLLPGDPHALLLEEEVTSFRTDALHRLGLTPRETEVLHAATAMEDEADIAWSCFSASRRPRAARGPGRQARRAHSRRGRRPGAPRERVGPTRGGPMAQAAAECGERRVDRRPRSADTGAVAQRSKNCAICLRLGDPNHASGDAHGSCNARADQALSPRAHARDPLPPGDSPSELARASGILNVLDDPPASLEQLREALVNEQAWRARRPGTCVRLKVASRRSTPGHFRSQRGSLGKRVLALQVESCSPELLRPRAPQARRDCGLSAGVLAAGPVNTL